MIPAQFTVHRTRAEQDVIAMKWRRTLRRRHRRANKSVRYGETLRRSYEQLFRDNLAALERVTD